jgi:RNA polymerase sigma-70 factor (ECF subfamily)
MMSSFSLSIVFISNGVNIAEGASPHAFQRVIHDSCRTNLAGDRRAFERLYYQLFRYLISYIGDRDAASDLAQETLAKAWNKWPERHNVSHVKSWLFTIATNLAIDHLRRRQKHPNYSFETIASHVEEGRVATLIVTHGSDFPETYLEQREEQDWLRGAMAQVTPVYRDCLILYLLEDVTQREIALLLRKDVRTVQRYLSRGKEELRQAYLKLSSQETERRISHE